MRYACFGHGGPNDDGPVRIRHINYRHFVSVSFICCIQVSFADYMIDGSLAITIRQRCVEAYKFIVKHFDANLGSKVYLFGLSRGAHTVSF